MVAISIAALTKPKGSWQRRIASIGADDGFTTTGELLRNGHKSSENSRLFPTRTGHRVIIAMIRMAAMMTIVASVIATSTTGSAGYPGPGKLIMKSLALD